MTATLDRPATTAPERSRGIPHVAALDGLRGVAILAVLVYHGGHLSGGFLGVDLFFVLSGYLITSLLLAEWRATSGISLGGFYARRARRLLPALLLMLLGVSLYAAIWAQPAELARIRGDALATLAYVANWHTIFGGHTYWSLFSAPSPLEHTWSLAIEEQFYLVWPLVALAVLRRSRDAARALLLVSLTGACAAGAWMVVLVLRGADVSRVYLGTDTRIAAMLFGAALAAGQARFAPLRARARRYLEIAAILAACFLAWAYASAGGLDSWLYRGGLFACGVAATVIIAAVTHPHRGPLAYLFAWKPLCGLGLVSYGLYLWHWPVYLVLNPSRTHLTDPALLIVRIGASLVIATVSYVLVEIPIRRGALAPRVARALAPATACAAAIAILATTASSAVPSVAMSSDAMPSIAMSSGSVSSVAVLPAARASAAASARRAVGTGSITNPCDLFDPPSPPPPMVALARQPRVLVVGDSVACFVGASIERFGPEMGISPLNRGEIDCALADAPRIRYDDGSTSHLGPQCDRLWPATVQAFEPRIIILMQALPGMYDWRVDGSWRHPCDPVFDSWWEASLEARLRELTGAGTPVVVTTIAPPPDHIAANPNFTLPHSLIDAAACLDRQLRSAADRVPNTHVVDLEAYICRAGHCAESMNGVELRHDGVHFIGAGADLIARWLVPRALAAAHVAARPH